MARNSIRTEDGFSIISRPPDHQVTSIHSNIEDDEDHLVSATLPVFTSPLTESEAPETENLHTSYYALGTAYEHIKRRLETAELHNRRLKGELIKFRQPSQHSPSVGMTSSTTRDKEIAEVWEAYSDKCRECEKLRDELREVQSDLVKSQSAPREQLLQNEIRVAKSQHDEMRKRMQELELVGRDLKDKEQLAREELEKEKEYHERVCRVAEQKHHEMQKSIDEFQRALQDKERQHSELVKEHAQHLQTLELKSRDREQILKSKMHDLEEKILREQEERSRAEREVSNLTRWKDQQFASSGLPPMDHNHHNEERFDLADMIEEVRNLNQELERLKLQTKQQNTIMLQICEYPQLRQHCKSVDNFHVNGQTQQAGLETSQTMTSELNKPMMSELFGSVDQRQVLGESSSIMMSSSTTDVRLSPEIPLAFRRKIHNVEPPSTTASQHQHDATPKHESQLLHRIDIPQDASNAFENLRRVQLGTNTIPLPDHVHPIDANHSSQNLIGADHSQYFSAVVGELGDADVPSTLTGDQLDDPPFTSRMLAVWPGKTPAPSGLQWPPVCDDRSFDVIASPDSPLMTSHVHRTRVVDATLAAPLIARREFAGQASSSVLTSHLPPNHPTNRPATRHRDEHTQTRAPTNDDGDDGTGGATEVETSQSTDSSTIPYTNCPVCNLEFEPGSTQHFVRHHINSHFSDEDEVVSTPHTT